MSPSASTHPTSVNMSPGNHVARLQQVHCEHENLSSEWKHNMSSGGFNVVNVIACQLMGGCSVVQCNYTICEWKNLVTSTGSM